MCSHMAQRQASVIRVYRGRLRCEGTIRVHGRRNEYLPEDWIPDVRNPVISRAIRLDTGTPVR